MLLVLVKVVHQLTNKLKWIALGVQSEEAAELHVVDISPHSLERDLGFAVVGYNFGNLPLHRGIHTCIGGSQSPSRAS